MNMHSGKLGKASLKSACEKIRAKAKESGLTEKDVMNEILVARRSRVCPETSTREIFKLQSELLVAEKQIEEGAQLLEHDEVIARVRGKINAVKSEKAERA